MKRVILFLMGLSLMAVSCEDDNKKPDTPPNPPVEKGKSVAEILKVFGHINDGDVTAIKGDLAESSVADMLLWEKELKEIKALTNVAAEGKAGYLLQKEKKRFVNAKGVETGQLIAKGLIGAFQLNGFTKSLMGGIRAKDEAGRKDALDKGVAYLLGDYKESFTADDYNNAGNSFGKYLVKISSQPKAKGIDKQVYATIKSAYANTGDAAKYMADLVKLNSLANKVVAFRAVYYLAGYGGKIKDEKAGGMSGENVHELSEGLGFAYSLAFAYNAQTHNSYITIERAKKFGHIDLWKESKDKSGNSDLDKSAKEIADLFGFTVADALLK